MKHPNILISAAYVAVFALSAVTAQAAASLGDNYTCQFEDLPPMSFQRRDATHYILRIGNALPVKLNVGSQFSIAEFQGQELIFWTQGYSVEIAGVVFKGECK